MLKNYFKIALRHLQRNRFFSILNISGLALGMACSIMIFLWIMNERDVNSWHKYNKQLYIVYEQQYHDGQIDGQYSTPGVLPAELKKVVPEVEFATGFAWSNLNTVQAGDKIMKQLGNNASEDFFKMFSFQLLEGTAATALNTPVSIAISQKMAEDFFETPKKAMGQTLRFQNRLDLKVTAVFENIKDNTPVKFDYLINWELFLKENTWAQDWGNNGPRTYIMLRKDADAKKVAAKIRKFIDLYDKNLNPNFVTRLALQPFGESYLKGNFKNGEISGGRIEYVRLFSIVAIFILIIACINFMNLTTARSIKRSKEIGIRKVAGAFRSTLVRQFIGEAIFITMIAVAIAFLLVFLLLPSFNSITGKNIELPYGQPLFWIGLIGLTLLTGFISGSYPALFLSSFQPIKVLKGMMKFTSGATWLRKGLVVFQFVLSIVLIIGTIIVSRQINFVQTVNLGYDRDNLVYLPLEGDLIGKYQLLKSEGSRIPGVKEISRITQTPTDISNGTGGVEWEGKDPNSRPQFTQASIGYEFIKTLNLKLKEGRDFSKDFATDSVNYLINESAQKLMNMKDPIGKSIVFWGTRGNIVGVLKDFHFTSLHEPIRPLILRLGENEVWGSAMIRIEGSKTKEALAGLEKICKQLNPQFPFTYEFSDAEYQRMYKSEMIVGKLSNIFAFLGILISCLGLLGLAMFTAEQRTKEFGVRKVLGASVQSLFSLMAKDFLVLVAVAFVIAVPLAWWAGSSWMKNFAYKSPIGWWIFGIAGILALLIALITVSFQAIKAALANPVRSLRSE